MASNDMVGSVNLTDLYSTYNATSNYGTIYPTWLDKGDNAWQLTAATLVGLQSIPGLVVLYGGLVKTKWAINTAFMCFYGFAATLVVWTVWAYNMSFGDQMIPGLVGIPKPVLSSNTELQQV